MWLRQVVPGWLMARSTVGITILRRCVISNFGIIAIRSGWTLPFIIVRLVLDGERHENRG